MADPTDLADGYYTVPVGKIVNAVTWFEMRSAPRKAIAPPLSLRPVAKAEADQCRALFAEIGTPWLWSRAFAVPDSGGPPDDAHFAFTEDHRVGIVEFAGRSGRDVEITWFGLTPDASGRGLGRRMMAAALDLAWAAGPDRVWLHTCSFDHPAAPRFYTSCGFRPYAAGFEIMDDPRLTGLLPRTAAPQVPLIGTCAGPDPAIQARHPG